MLGLLIPAAPQGRGALLVCVLGDLGQHGLTLKFGRIQQLAQVVDLPLRQELALRQGTNLQVSLENRSLWNRCNVLLGFLAHLLVPLSL